MEKMTEGPRIISLGKTKSNVSTLNALLILEVLFRRRERSSHSGVPEQGSQSLQQNLLSERRELFDLNVTRELGLLDEAASSRSLRLFREGLGGHPLREVGAGFITAPFLPCPGLPAGTNLTAPSPGSLLSHQSLPGKMKSLGLPR